MNLAWGAKLEPEVRARLLAIAAELKCDASQLSSCIEFESRWDPAARNQVSDASGLIQFMPGERGSAAALGTTTAAIRAMTRMQQLELVRRYFLPYRGRLATFADTYMAILWPAAVGKPDDTVIFPPGSKAWLQNKGLDINHDGEVTKAEAASFPAKRLAEGLLPGNVFVIESAPKSAAIDAAPQEEPMGAIALPLLAQLIPQVLTLFSGRAQAQIAKATGASPDVAGQFMQNLITKVGDVAGVPVTDAATAIQAVAAVTASPDPAKVGELEDHSLDYLDKVGPYLDKLHGMAKDEWAASQASTDAAGVRNAQMAQEGPWFNPAFLIALIILAMVGFVVASVLWKDVLAAAFGLRDIGGFSTDMQAFVIGAIVGSSLTAVITYFYGTNRQSAVKDATIARFANKQA